MQPFPFLLSNPVQYLRSVALVPHTRFNGRHVCSHIQMNIIMFGSFVHGFPLKSQTHIRWQFEILMHAHRRHCQRATNGSENINPLLLLLLPAHALSHRHWDDRLNLFTMILVFAVFWLDFFSLSLSYSLLCCYANKKCGQSNLFVTRSHRVIDPVEVR